MRRSLVTERGQAGGLGTPKQEAMVLLFLVVVVGGEAVALGLEKETGSQIGTVATAFAQPSFHCSDVERNLHFN